MKKFFLLLITLVFLLNLMGCKKQENDKNIYKKLNLAETVIKISETAEFDTVFEVDAEYLANAFDWDPNNNIEVRGLFGNIKDTNRVLLFRIKSDYEKYEVLDFLDLLREKIKEIYSSSMEYEKSIFEKAIILDSGHYILFITGENAQMGSSYFENLLNQ